MIADVDVLPKVASLSIIDDSRGPMDAQFFPVSRRARRTRAQVSLLLFLNFNGVFVCLSFLFKR